MLGPAVYRRLIEKHERRGNTGSLRLGAMRMNARTGRSTRSVLWCLAVVAAHAWFVFYSGASPGEARVPGGPPRCAVAPAEAATVAAGDLPARATPFDDHLPGIANLDPDLLSALRAAARRAAADGVAIEVNSGWRSPEHQAWLLCEAVAEHGSEQEAARWVAPASTSLHVTGEAVDVGPAAAAEWLAAHGPAFGLCRVYRNEPWHFELRPDAVRSGCPPLYRDPTRDPRLR